MFINSYKRRRKRKNTFSIHVLWICSVHLTPQNTLKKKGWQPATQCSAQKPILVVSALVHGQEFSEFIWIEFYLTSFSFSFSFQDPLSLTCQNHQSNRSCIPHIFIVWMANMITRKLSFKGKQRLSSNSYIRINKKKRVS